MNFLDAAKRYNTSKKLLNESAKFTDAEIYQYFKKLYDKMVADHLHKELAYQGAFSDAVMTFKLHDEDLRKILKDNQFKVLNEARLHKTIDAKMKKYLNYDDADPIEKEFGEIYLKYKKGRISALPPEIKRLEGKAGFVGSGKWLYEFKGKKFEVSGGANGKGFWGTDYSIWALPEEKKEPEKVINEAAEEGEEKKEYDGEGPRPWYVDENGDGWNKDTLDEVGLIQWLEDTTRVSYEINNAARGAYCRDCGDDDSTLVSYLEVLKDRLESVIEEIESKHGDIITE
jgi:hypothetical protein